MDKLGQVVDIIDVNKSHKYFQKAKAEREKLLENLALFDEAITEKIVNNQEISQIYIQHCIKAVIGKHSKETCVVLLGSSLKNRGIQLLMDAVIKYLPSPSEKPPICDIRDPLCVRKPERQEKLCAYAYKIINDPQKGLLTYVRIYSGTLYARQ